MTILCLWSVRSNRFDRVWSEQNSDSIIFEKLWRRRESLDAHFYDMDDRYGFRGELNQYLCSSDEFETDYNDEIFDGGYWCKVVHLLPSVVKGIITEHTVPFTPKNTEFFSIIDGMVHIEAYLWKDDEGGWRLTEYTFCICPIKEFIEGYAERGQEFVDELESEVTQYESIGLSEDEARDITLNYMDAMEPLNYKEITENTPEGNYRTK